MEEKDELEQIKKDIGDIKQRNLRVEIEKSWETSFVRKIIVALLTYVVMVLFFIFAQLSKPFLNPIVPTLGFILSTFSISYLKKIWMKSKNRNSQK